MAAGVAVANTNELVEHILLYLPLRQLLLAQKIGKFFRDVINDSVKIKAALFLDFSTAHTVEWYPLRNFEPESIRDWQFYGDWRATTNADSVNPLLNPFLWDHKSDRMTIRQRSTSLRKVMKTAFAACFNKRRDGRSLRKMAFAAWFNMRHDVRSLRKMSLIYPPVSRLQWQNAKRWSSHPGHSYDIVRIAGVRVGDVLEGTQR